MPRIVKCDSFVGSTFLCLLFVSFARILKSFFMRLKSNNMICFIPLFSSSPRELCNQVGYFRSGLVKETFFYQKQGEAESRKSLQESLKFTFSTWIFLFLTSWLCNARVFFILSIFVTMFRILALFQHTACVYMYMHERLFRENVRHSMCAGT